MNGPSLGRRAFLLLVLSGWALLIPFHLHLLAGHHRAQVDDAFISFRYSERWAEGRGLTWNDGDAVEGFSNPLWTLTLGVAARWGGVPPDRAAPWLAAAFLAGLVPVLVAFASRVGWGTARATFLILVGALDTGLVLWSGSGLETAQVAFLVGLALLLAAGVERSPGRALAFGAVSGLLALSRPEAGGWALLALLWLVWGAWAPPRTILAFLGGVLPPVALWSAWRWVAFGALLPNTFFAKMEADLRGAGPGATTLVGWGVAHAGVLLWIALGLGLAAASRPAFRWPPGPGTRRFLLLPGGWLAAQCGFVLLAGGDWMGETRYLAPLMPALAILVVSFPAPRERGAPRLAVAVAFLAWAATVVPGYVLRDRIPDYTREGEAVGRWLRAVAEPGDRVAVTAAGAIPYFSRLPALDVLGINDRAVRGRSPRRTDAWAPGHSRYDLERLMARRPEWIVWDFGVRVNRTRMKRLEKWDGEIDRLDYRRELLARTDFRRDYGIDEQAPAPLVYTVFRRRE